LEEIIIQYKPEVEYYLEDLIDILFEEEYFGFESYAQDYGAKIIDFIENNISIFPSRISPRILKNFGSNYIFYKANQRTTWYIFFEKLENK
jgi:hypothetical protein